MKKENKNIDQFFSRKLKNFKAEPPAEVWSEVVRNLDHDRRRNRIAVFMRVAAVISLLTALTITGLLVRDASTTRQVVLQQERSADTTIQDGTVAVDKTPSGESPVVDENRQQVKPAEDNAKIIHTDTYFADRQEETAQEEPDHREVQPVGEPAEATWPHRFLAGRNISHIKGEYGMISDKLVREPSGKTAYTPVSNQTELDDYLAEYMVDEEVSSRKKWSVGTNATPLYSYRNIGNTDAAQPMAQSNSYYNQVESGTMAYAGGVHVNYAPAKRLSFQSGVYYSKSGISVDHNYYETNLASAQDVENLRLNYSQVRNTTGIITSTAENAPEFDVVSNESWDRMPHKTQILVSELNATVYEGEIIQNFEYLEIPMLVRYRLIDRRIGFNVLGGVSTNLLVGSDAYYSDDNSMEKIGKTTNLKPVNYSSIFGLGLDYSLTENLSINLEPTFRYYINSVNASGLKSYPYSMGIFTGLSYYF